MGDLPIVGNSRIVTITKYHGDEIDEKHLH